jgi:transposase
VIRRLDGEGWKKKPIARELGIDPGTVRTVLRQTARRERKRRPSKLDSFKPLIHKLVLTDELSVVRVLEEIEAVGYTGGESILKRYVQTFRPKSVRRPHLRFETAPGVQGQVDLSPYTVLLSGEPTPVVCFSFVLGYSRWHFIRFMLHADVHTICSCHVLAFEDAGGVPHEILYDRMKQVVLESHKDGVIYHALFERLAQHYGFRAVPLAPGYKEGKGKVENLFKYVEGNFLAGRTFVDLDDLNRQARAWLVDKARVRVHKTTREQPSARMAEEQPSLIRLPEQRFEAGVVVPRLVGADFCVAWDTNRYSVAPRFASKSAMVRVLDGRIEILIDGAVVAAHPVGPTKYQRYVAPEHEAEFRATCTSRHVLKDQFQRLGSGAEPFAAGLIELHGGSAGYHMGQILKLADQVGVPRVAEALRHAARYGAFDHNAVARIVAGKPAKASAKPESKGGPPERLGGSPTQITQYLKGTGVHQRSPDGYKKLASKRTPSSSKPTDDHPKKKEDEGDGQ